MLSAAILTARLILAAVFAVAGIAKLRDRAGTRRAVVGFGVPGSFAAPLTLALPFAELAVAILLLPASAQVVGAVGALILFAVFSAAIAVNLARGRSPECHCFGQLHSAPASWRTLVRNGLLAALGVVILAEGLRGTRPSFVSMVETLDATALLALAGGLIATGFALAFVSLTRSYGRVLLRLDALERRLTEAGIELDGEPGIGLPPGTAVPSDDDLGALLPRGKPIVLLFTSENCGPCKTLLPTVEAWQRDYGEDLTVTVTEDDRIHAAFEVAATPSAVLIAADGTVASYLAQGAESIERLLERVLAEREQMGLPVGAPAPALMLPTLAGGTLSLDELAGEETVLLFWNPDCGFCRSMRDELLAWEQHAPTGAPRLIVVSSGDEASTRAEGFSSPVALDLDFSAGAAYGAGGTPMAVLLDREGRVASPLAAGAEAVFALAGGRGLVDSGPDLPVAVRAAP